MIALAGLLVLVAVGLLVARLGNGDTTLLWASVGVSALAAVVLVVQSLQRSRATAAEAERTTPPAEQPAATAVAATPEADAPAAATPTVVVGSTGGATASGAAVTEAPGTPVTTPDAGVQEPAAPAAAAPVGDDVPAVGSHSARPVGVGGPAADPAGEPPEEEVEVTDLLIVLDLTDEVVVVDEHPRYHLPGCAQTAGQEEILLPLDEAREDGFTACGTCQPDRHLAEVERGRRTVS